MDGPHIALAAVNGMDMMASLNFKHIVKEKTIKMTRRINERNGHRTVEMYSPEEVMKDEKEDRSDRARGR